MGMAPLGAIPTIDVPKRGKGRRWRTRWMPAPIGCWPFPHTPIHSHQPLATCTEDRMIRYKPSVLSSQ